MIVGRYGIHIAPGDIPFLLQPEGAQNLISPELRFPFQPHIRPKTLRCPHSIMLSDGIGVEIPPWAEDPLLRTFLPIPRAPGDKTILVHDPDGLFASQVTALVRLSSPTGSPVWPTWARRPDEMSHLYGVTNLSPMIFTSAEVTHTRHVDQHIALAAAQQRQLVVICREKLPIYDGGVAWVAAPTALPLDEPLEAIGAAALRKYMQSI